MKVGEDTVTNGKFDVYFDNIEIKTKGTCDKKKPLAKAITPKKNLGWGACGVAGFLRKIISGISRVIRSPEKGS